MTFLILAAPARTAMGQDLSHDVTPGSPAATTSFDSDLTSIPPVASLTSLAHYTLSETDGGHPAAITAGAWPNQAPQTIGDAMPMQLSPVAAPSAVGPRRIPMGLRALLGTQAVLHTTDMFTTVHLLRTSDRAREANPLLAPFAGRPAALFAVGSAVNALQMYTIYKIYRRHPKAAIVWSLILISAEAYAVTNNVRVAGELRRTR